MEKEFPDAEIPFSKPNFHKIPLADWRVEEFVSETPPIQVGLGWLSNEVWKTRSKLSENEELGYEDLTHMADLHMDLSIRLKERSR